MEAKAKVRDRHKNAIAHFQKWRRENKDATLEEQVKQFDFLVDTSMMQQELDAA